SCFTEEAGRSSTFDSNSMVFSSLRCQRITSGPPSWPAMLTCSAGLSKARFNRSVKAWTLGVFRINPTRVLALERFINLLRVSDNAFKLAGFRVTHHQMTNDDDIVRHGVQVLG